MVWEIRKAFAQKVQRRKKDLKTPQGESPHTDGGPRRTQRKEGFFMTAEGHSKLHLTCPCTRELCVVIVLLWLEPILMIQCMLDEADTGLSLWFQELATHSHREVGNRCLSLTLMHQMKPWTPRVILVSLWFHTGCVDKHGETFSRIGKRPVSIAGNNVVEWEV